MQKNIIIRETQKKIKYFSLVKKNKFISSKAFMFIADSLSYDIRSSTPNYIVPTFKNKEFINSKYIYCCSDALEKFEEKFLIQKKIPFVLITGDSDRPINFNYSTIKNIEGSKNIAKWYAQNLEYISSKTEIIPIGLDYISAYHDTHLINFNPYKNNINPNEHEKIIINIIKKNLNFEKRKDKVFCNFHFSLERGNRKECIKKINHQLCYFLEKKINFIENYNEQVKYKFILSPHGAGLDCHRTWESLVLGNIPIVKKSPIDHLYDGLPIIILDKWEDLNSEILSKFSKDHEKKKYSYFKLLTAYWEDKILDNKQRKYFNQTYLEFINSLKIN